MPEEPAGGPAPPMKSEALSAGDMTPPTLTYQTRFGRPRARISAVRVMAILLAVLAFVAFLRRDRILDRLDLLSLQRSIADHQLPDGQPALWAVPPDPRRPDSPSLAIYADPRVHEWLKAVGEGVAPDAAPLLLRRLHTAEGTPYTVMLLLHRAGDLDARCYSTATWFSRARAMPVALATQWRPLEAFGVPGDAIHAARADPQDPSHFTLVVRKGGVEGLVDGYLMDNPLRIKLEPRLPTP